MTVEANTLTPEPATRETRETNSIVAEHEPAFLVRARRIFGGDICPEDYLTIPEEIQSAIAIAFNDLFERDGFKVAEQYITQTRSDWMLQYAHECQPIACRYTESGVIVFAVGLEEIRTFLECFTRPDERAGFFLTTPPPWQTPTPLDSLSPSKQLQHHSG
jgi:hypothetical protein